MLVLNAITLLIVVILLIYTYFNIIIGGLLLIFVLGFFLLYLKVIPRYVYVLIKHPYLKIKNNMIIFERLKRKKDKKSTLPKVVIFGADSIPLPATDLALDAAKRELAEQLLKNTRRTGELLAYKVIGTRVLICFVGICILGSTYLLPLSMNCVCEVGYIPQAERFTQLSEFSRYIKEDLASLPFKSINSYISYFTPEGLKKHLLNPYF